MKKSLLALAVVAGFSSVAQADTTTLYGRLAYEIDLNNKGEKVSDTLKVWNNKLDLSTYSVRLGVKGVEDLNNGLKALYNLEFAYSFDGDATNRGKLSEVRQANLGFQGAFGTVTIGKQSHLHSLWAGKADNMNSLSGAHSINEMSGRLAKAVSFVSPATGGVQVGAAFTLDGSGTAIDVGTSRNIRAYQAGVNYEVNGLEASFVYTGIKGDQKDVKYGTSEVYAGGVAYQNDTFRIGGDYWHVASKGDYFAVGGQYFMGDNTFSADVEFLNPKGAKNETLKVGLGYQYKLSKRTRAWIEGAYAKHKAAGSKNTYATVVGVRHDF